MQTKSNRIDHAIAAEAQIDALVAEADDVAALASKSALAARDAAHAASVKAAEARFPDWRG